MESKRRIKTEVPDGEKLLLAPVNKIIDNSIVDGPGNRTAVFFQGCNFDCTYCHNPETIHTCTGCGACVSVCPAGALTVPDLSAGHGEPARHDESGSHGESGSPNVPARHGVPVWNSALCCGCDACIKTCPSCSSPKITWMSPEAVEARIKNNMPFIRGVTCSGGECTLQAGFIARLFTRTKALGLTNLLDSNGSMEFQEDELLSLTDGVMLDIKAFDPEVHRTLTAMDNKTVLSNAVFLAERGKLPEIRTVVIPGILPNEETVFEITRLLSPFLSAGEIRYKLIKYRPMGVRQEYLYASPDDALMQKLKTIAEGNGFKDIVII